MKNLTLIAITFYLTYNALSQNIGIGTLTPTDKLSVVNNLPGYGVTHNYGPVTLGTFISNLNAQFGTKSNHPLQFFTNNGNAQITLLQNGNVGIGTDVPSQRLSVNGNVVTQGTDAGFRFIDRLDKNKEYEWFTYEGKAYLYKRFFPFGNPLTVTANGNIGFNNDNPQTNLHIDPAGAGSVLIGTNKSSGGFTNLEIGITSQSNGKGYIQSTLSSGSSYGDFHINPHGGYVGINMPTASTAFAPIDIQQSNGTRGLRLRNELSASYQDFWDISSNDYLHFRGNNSLVAFINLAGDYVQVSDERLKTNTTRMESVLNKLLSLKPSKYEYINNNRTHKISSGLLAQEVINVFPELVSDFKNPTGNSTENETYYGINYAGFSIVAIKAIQEQHFIIDNQQKSIDTLATEIEKLKALISNK